MSSPKNILFLVPYPLRNAPSQRFRVENFLPLLQGNNITYEISPFLDEETYRILYKNGALFRKIAGIFSGFLRRFKTVLFDVRRFDYVFVHREASPLGPPLFEWLITKLWRKKMVYDFDDAIWVSEGGNRLLNWFKAPWKIKWICKWASRVAGGNDYLCAYARQYNQNVTLLPTCVDVENQHNRMTTQQNGKVVIGWTGSHSTLRYLDPYIPVLKEMTAKHGAEFLVICNTPPAFSFQGLRYLPWSEETEIKDLLNIHIGIMPLETDKWSEGKCGFKLIQYLALGIPAIASPVGVNKKIIDPGLNGMLCTQGVEWKKALESLIANETLRQEMGKRGREKMIARYSLQANEGFFLGLFE